VHRAWVDHLSVSKQRGKAPSSDPANFGQLRRNTDHKNVHHLAQLALAVVFLLTAKLIDWRNRWCQDLSLSADALS
jgi:hypothetical protein